MGGFQRAVAGRARERHASVVKVRSTIFSQPDSSRPGSRNRVLSFEKSYSLAHTFGPKSIGAARLSDVRGDYACAVD